MRRWMVNVVLVACSASLCFGQAELPTTADEAWHVYERSLSEAQGIAAAEFVPWIDQFNLNVLGIDEHPSYAALQDWMTVFQSHHLIAQSFVASSEGLNDFLGEYDIFLLRRRATPDEELQGDEMARWTEQQTAYRHQWVDHLAKVGLWETLDRAVGAGPVLLAEALHVRSTRGLARSLAMRLESAITRGDPQEIELSVRAFGRLAELRALWPATAPAFNVIEASSMPALLRLTLFDAISRDAWTDAGIQGALQALEPDLQLDLSPWVLAQHARMLSELEAAPSMLERAQQEGDREQIREVEAMLEHVDALRAEILDYTSHQLGLIKARQQKHIRQASTLRDACLEFENMLKHHDEMNSRDHLRVFVAGFTAANDTVRTSAVNAQALWSACKVVLACERARLKWGRWPEDLEEITPRLLSSIPADPWDMTGGPLRYKVEGDTFTLWSVGPDGIDNGGTPDPEGTTSVGEGFDLVLWPRD